MKKLLILAVSAILVLMFSISHATENTEERYYIGIGASFEVAPYIYKRSADGATSAIDMVYVAGILKGGPAERAGLSVGDVVVSVGDALYPRASVVVEFIRNKTEGSVAVLKLRKAKQAGFRIEELVGEVFEIHVPRAKIDSVAWLPMDRISQSSLSVGGDVQLIVEAKISESKETGEFTYWHRITNKGKKEIYMQWEIIDRLKAGLWPELVLVSFNPGESREFVLKSKLLPTMVDKPVRGFKKGYDRDDKELDKDYGFSMSGDKDNVLHVDFGMGATGFIPRKFLKN